VKRLVALLAITALLLPALATAPVAAQDYGLSELKQDGKHYGVDGARIVSSEQRVYWLEHRPANQPWVKVTSGENGPKFGSGKMLKTNQLYLRTIRAQTGSEPKTVKIVSWQQGQRTVRQGNVTTTEQVAKNVSVTTQQVSMGPGWSVAEVNMPQHDETRRVTMWIEGAEDTARWTFKHRSVATTQEVAINTWGDFLFKLLQYVGIPALIGGVVVGKQVRSMVDSAGVGPDWGFGRWTIVITGLTALVGGVAYTQLAEAIVYLPYLLGVWLVGVFAAYTLATHRGEIKAKGLLKPHVKDSVSVTDSRLDDTVDVDGEVKADGGHAEGDVFAHDVLQGDWSTIRVIEDKDGMSIVRPGIVPFLARVYGARATVENVKELTQRFKIAGPIDEILLVDPEADRLLEYEPPSFRWDWPDLDTRSAQFKAAIGLAAGAGLTWRLATEWGVLVYAVAALLAAAVAAKFYLKPTDGYAYIEPAPMHFRNVFASTMVLRHGLRDVKDLSKAKKQARLEQLKTKDEAKGELDDHDRAMMDHFAGVDEVDVEDVLDDDNDTSEVTDGDE
jgi:hypothetical protein